MKKRGEWGKDKIMTLIKVAHWNPPYNTHSPYILSLSYQIPQHYTYMLPTPLFSSILLYLKNSFLLLTIIARHSTSTISNPTIPKAAVNTKFKNFSANREKGPTQPNLFAAAAVLGQVESRTNGGVL